MGTTDDPDPTAAARRQIEQRLERGMGSVRTVIETAGEMRTAEIGDPAHNDQRIIDGETELAALQQELDAVRGGDRKALRDAASTMPPPGHEVDP